MMQMWNAIFNKVVSVGDSKRRRWTVLCVNPFRV
jgi:hypothetical protein